MQIDMMNITKLQRKEREEGERDAVLVNELVGACARGEGKESLSLAQACLK
jgi:hypothetical protein